MKKIILELKAVDFDGTYFVDNTACAICKAVYRQLGSEIANEGVHDIKIDGKTYLHEAYHATRFDEDRLTALGYLSKGQPEKVIRKLTLTPEKP